MNENKGRKPDFVNNKMGISVWTNQSKENKTYLSIKIPILGIDVAVFSTKDPSKTEIKEEKVE